MAKERREELKKQKREAERSIRPIQEKHVEMEGKVNQIQAKTKALEVKARNEKKNHDDCLNKMENHAERIDVEVSEYQSLDSQHRKALKELDKEKRRLQEIMAEADDFPSMEETDRTIAELTAELRATKTKFDRAKRNTSELNDEIQKAADDSKRAKEKLAKMKDEKKHRLQRLFSKDQSVKKAYEWIDQNRKLFRKAIHGPIGKWFVR